MTKRQMPKTNIEAIENIQDIFSSASQDQFDSMIHLLRTSSLFECFIHRHGADIFIYQVPGAELDINSLTFEQTESFEYLIDVKNQRVFISNEI